MRNLWLFPIAGMLLAGCAASIPSGPSVMVLPGSGKNFEQFRADDSICRQWAGQQSGISANRAVNDTAIQNAAIGTVLGAAGGAAIGAATGNPATGAAVGSGVGLLGGSAVGANNAARAGWTVQHRYDVAYMQCMYAKGNQIPVSANSRRPPPPPPRRMAPTDIPPPPPGLPPPPPGS